MTNITPEKPQPSSEDHSIWSAAIETAVDDEIITVEHPYPDFAGQKVDLNVRYLDDGTIEIRYHFDQDIMPAIDNPPIDPTDSEAVLNEMGAVLAANWVQSWLAGYWAYHQGYSIRPIDIDYENGITVFRGVKR